jgi:hypothetical protein
MRALCAAIILCASCFAQQLITRSPEGAFLMQGQSDPPYKPVPCHNPKNHATDLVFKSLPPFNDNGPLWWPLSEGKRVDFMNQRKELEQNTDEISKCEVRGLTAALEAQ